MVSTVSRQLAGLIRDWSRRQGLSPSQTQLLEAVAEGREGDVLAGRLGVRPAELATLEQLFVGRTGRSPSAVIAELERIAVRRGRS